MPADHAPPRPDRIVPVENFSEDTLRNIVAHLEVSTDFEHFIYRESELDAICRLVELAIDREQGQAGEGRLERLRRLGAAARDAHDLVADEQPAQAVARLRQVLGPASGQGR